jgi:hypothetical protein
MEILQPVLMRCIEYSGEAESPGTGAEMSLLYQQLMMDENGVLRE